MRPLIGRLPPPSAPRSLASRRYSHTFGLNAGCPLCVRSCACPCFAARLISVPFEMPLASKADICMKVPKCRCEACSTVTENARSLQERLFNESALIEEIRLLECQLINVRQMSQQPNVQRAEQLQTRLKEIELEKLSLKDELSQERREKEHLKIVLQEQKECYDATIKQYSNKVDDYEEKIHKLLETLSENEKYKEEGEMLRHKLEKLNERFAEERSKCKKIELSLRLSEQQVQRHQHVNSWLSKLVAEPRERDINGDTVCVSNSEDESWEEEIERKPPRNISRRKFNIRKVKMEPGEMPIPTEPKRELPASVLRKRALVQAAYDAPPAKSLNAIRGDRRKTPTEHPLAAVRPKVVGSGVRSYPFARKRNKPSLPTAAVKKQNGLIEQDVRLLLREMVNKIHRETPHPVSEASIYFLNSPPRLQIVMEEPDVAVEEVVKDVRVLGRPKQAKRGRQSAKERAHSQLKISAVALGRTNKPQTFSWKQKVGLGHTAKPSPVQETQPEAFKRPDYVPISKPTARF